MTSPTLFRTRLEERFKRNTRQALDEQLHFVPLTTAALEVSLSKIIAQTEKDLTDEEKDDNPGWEDFLITLEDFRDKIINGVIKDNKKISGIVKAQNRIRIQGSEIFINGTRVQNTTSPNIKQYTPAVIYVGMAETPENIVGALYPKYSSASKSLFGEFLNKALAQFIKKSIYTLGKAKDFNYTRRFNVGHTTGIEVLNQQGNVVGQLAKTPLQLKIENLLDELQIAVSQTSGTQQADLLTLQTQVTEKFNNFLAAHQWGPKIAVTLDKNASDFLLQVGANIVIIQDEFENQYLYNQLFESPTSREIYELLLTINFSKNIIQEIGSRIATNMAEGISIPKHTSKVALDAIHIPQNPKITLTGGGAKNTRAKNSTGIRTQGGQFYSLASLQQLLNSLLVKTVKENMGTGSRRDILNLRTGRFAESVKVERLSQSREGMITAFYSYMRNPYGTFSAGGRQESPKTRDPKLLIAKSIREIAETQVKNRLRAVLV
jgi:hypothetical protein